MILIQLLLYELQAPHGLVTAGQVAIFSKKNINRRVNAHLKIHEIRLGLIEHAGGRPGCLVRRAQPGRRVHADQLRRRGDRRRRGADLDPFAASLSGATLFNPKEPP